KIVDAEQFICLLELKTHLEKDWNRSICMYMPKIRSTLLVKATLLLFLAATQSLLVSKNEILFLWYYHGF
ncbi:hypothetical protein, partial [Alishewanella sp. HH-ZS]|uniref:hypothetical protein n=1 Tax=Alishewanella sp. HH-ZS TaxID=1856684 RepID=UPI001C4012BE